MCIPPKFVKNYISELETGSSISILISPLCKFGRITVEKDQSSAFSDTKTEEKDASSSSRKRNGKEKKPGTFCKAIGLWRTSEVTLRTTMDEDHSWQVRFLVYENRNSGEPTQGWRMFCVDKQDQGRRHLRLQHC
ncbi:hypothetical protein C2845_PM15G04370 [Panicum miliaceum]|uniref:TF-B3 domain-containing protein n=1 Tax=Panicum miliaceum TaxID=4540 RepID=A0A3L6QBE3_PANMI|nr:hypothetical protein C2845_PM15G04370 [Panicum miliaceum]